jgi:hypothetical protein
MANSVLIALIAVIGGLAAVLGWKVLDIGKRAMELERTESGAREEP